MAEIYDEYLETGILQTSLWTTAAIMNERDRANAPWVDRFLQDVAPVEALGKVWEREVWFGGHGPRSGDTRYTEPMRYVHDIFEYRKENDGTFSPGVLPPGSLQEFVLLAKFRGYKAVVGDITYLSFTSAGRSLFQIERTDTGRHVTMISDEHSPAARSGIQSLHATCSEACGLLMRAIDDWKAGRIQLVDSSDVGF